MLWELSDDSLPSDCLAEAFCIHVERKDSVSKDDSGSSRCVSSAPVATDDGDCIRNNPAEEQTEQDECLASRSTILC